MKYALLLLAFAFSASSSLKYKPLLALMNELVIIKDYSEKIVKNIFFNKEKPSKYINILDANNMFFSYVVIDTNFNIIVRTIDTADKYNLIDNKKFPLEPYLEKVYFIFVPQISTNRFASVSSFDVWSNLDENFAAMNKLAIPQDFTQSFLIYDMPEMPIELIDLKFVSSATIFKTFPKLKEKYGIEDNLLYNKY